VLYVERGKRGVYCNKQKVKEAVTVLNCMFKGAWGERGSGSIRKKLKSRSVAYLFTFIHCNKLTIKVVSKPLLGNTILNQALIYTPIPNLISVI